MVKNVLGTFVCYFTEHPCTADYLLQTGDISGPGLGGGEVSSVEECARWCTNRSDCCVFEYSSSSKQCWVSSYLCMDHHIPILIFLQNIKSWYWARFGWHSLWIWHHFEEGEYSNTQQSDLFVHQLAHSSTDDTLSPPKPGPLISPVCIR